MSWFRVDDNFASHEKVVRIPRSIRAAAIGTWTLAGTWSARHRTDGYVAAYVVEEVGGTLAAAAALVEAKLWRRRGAGFVFVNWAEFQPTREQDEERRRYERDRKREQRAARAGDTPETPEITGDVPGDVPRDKTGPGIPSRPDPTSPETDHSQPQLPSGSPQAGDGSVQKARRNPTGIDEPRIVGRLEELVGEAVHVSVVEARLVAEHFTSRAKGDVQRPTAFVLGCITKHENAVANFLHTGRWSE